MDRRPRPVRASARKEDEMKVRLLSVLAATAALVAAGAASSSAASVHSVAVTLNQATSVSGTVLPAGRYHFSWTGNTDKVKVTIKDGHNVVVKADARLEERSQRATSQEVLTKTAESGSRVLEQLRLKGRKTALVFTAAS
jgi:hypothetical protein